MVVDDDVAGPPCLPTIVLCGSAKHDPSFYPQNHTDLIVWSHVIQVTKASHSIYDAEKLYNRTSKNLSHDQDHTTPPLSSRAEER